jgi:twitching motility two-component system response regulator PilG
MSESNGFPLFDTNSIERAFGRPNGCDRPSSALDPEARERMAALYREDYEVGDGSSANAAAEPLGHMPEGLDALLSRASDEQASQVEAPANATANEPLAPLDVVPMSHEEVAELAAEAAMPSPEEMVAEAMAAVEAGSVMPCAIAAEPASAEEAEAEVKELVAEIHREQSLAEIAEVAESFVAEQRGEVPAAPPETLAQLEQFASAKVAPEVLPVEPMTDLPSQSLASETPWETVADAAKRYEVAETQAQLEAVAIEAQAEPVVEVQPAIVAPAPFTPAKGAKPAAIPVENDRRRKRRALISAPLRVRSKNCTGLSVDEVVATVDVSRLGVLFQTESNVYSRGMELMVTFPYSKVPHGIQAEQPGVVARVQDCGDGKRRVAIMLGVIAGEHCVDAYGKAMGNTPIELSLSKSGSNVSERYTKLDVKKPLVLAVDASATTREALKCCLEREGYEVIALATAMEARDVLNVLTPALIFAEVEGDGLPGYDLCAHVKQLPRLRHIPVVLTTSSAYPSDYSSAHSLGAVVCMAKPYKMERIANIARVLAPPPALKADALTARAADPTRLPGRDMMTSRNGGAKTAASKNGNGKKAGLDAKTLFKFPSFRTSSR